MTENESSAVVETTEEDLPVIPDDWAMPTLFQPTITMANGRVLNGSAQKSNISDELWVYPEEQLSPIELVTLFGDPSNTQIIVSDVSTIEHVEYVGYTNMATIEYGTSGKPIVRLIKPLNS